jgi:sulfate permease, SulP family
MRADAIAGLPGAIVGIPDGLASGVLAGISPLHGLYASLAGPVAGSLGASTRLMVITTTGAASLAAGSATSGLPAEDRAGAVVLLTVLAGAFMIVASLFRLGRFTRFISQSVTLGFLTGVAVNIVLGQLADLTGARASGGSSVSRAVDVVLHPGRWDLPTLTSGTIALVLLAGLARTRWATISSLLALAVPTLVVVVGGLDSVARVADVEELPGGLPMPELPDLRQLSPSIVAGAAAVAAIVLVQGASVAQAAPNDDGPSDTNQDFMAQGAGNVVAGFVAGMPVGGSVALTALNVTAGARSRWAVIWSRLWMAVILVALSGAIGAVAIPTLAALLVFAAITSLRLREIVTILRTGANSQIAMVVTFVATLLLPVAAAVGVGVVISLLLQLNQEAVDLTVVQSVPDDAGRFAEQAPPDRLASESVTVLDVYGSLFYAGARTLQARLPDPTGAVRPVVLLRLRGRTTLGATFFAVASDYAERLEAVGGRLYLTGLAPALAARLRDPARPRLTGGAVLYESSPLVGGSTLEAYNDATTWLLRGGHRDDS